MLARTIMFDIEGTLVDSVQQVLDSWRNTLSRRGHDIRPAILQKLSGMDGADMLRVLIPGLDSVERQTLLREQAELFERDYLSQTRAFPNVRDTFLFLKSQGLKLGLATDCKDAPLRHYRSLLHIEDLIDGIACGEDVPEGKPSPALILRALDLLQADPHSSVLVGDTPYDMQAAARASAKSIGVTTGCFSNRELVDAGGEFAISSLDELMTVTPMSNNSDRSEIASSNHVQRG